MLEQGVIVIEEPVGIIPACCPEWGGRLRPCGDHRALNARTIPGRYSPLHIENFAQQLHGKRIFSKIDLVRAYYQILIASEDIEKTATATPSGLFEALNTRFGFHNTAQTCQRFVDEITGALGIVCTYIDDFLVTLEDEKQQRKLLRTLFNHINNYGVVINPAKCEFGAREITFFRYTVDVDGIKPLAKRMDETIKVPKSVTVKHLRRYID